MLELREHVLERLSEVGLDHLAHLLERHPRRRVAQLGELLLQPLVGLLAAARPVSTNEATWPNFIAAPFIWPEHVEDALGRLQLALLGRRAALLLRARQIGGAAGIGARGLAAGEPAEARGAPQAAGRDRVVVARHAP